MEVPVGAWLEDFCVPSVCDQGIAAHGLSKVILVPFRMSNVCLTTMILGEHLQVAREADLGSNDNMFSCRTHLGGFLKPGDIALGYDLARFVTADDNLDKYVSQGYQLPDVVLVKKCFDEVRAKRRAQQRPRAYKLKHLEMDRDDMNYHVKRGQAQEAQRAEDLETFMNVRVTAWAWLLPGNDQFPCACVMC